MATARDLHHIPRKRLRKLSEKMQQALASLSLEGIELSPEALDDLHQLDAGEMSKEDFFKRMVQRAKL